MRRLTTTGRGRWAPMAVAAALLAWSAATPSRAARLADIGDVQGVRENLLIGYGLVVGLDGTGDSSSSGMTIQSVMTLLSGLGLTVDERDIKSKNVAAVVVTATLDAFARPGQTLAVVASSIGDAKSLAGGTLLMTPLRAGNGQIYAVAQGPMTVGGYGGSGSGSSQTKNHLNVGRIPEGAIVEQAVLVDLLGRDHLDLSLHDADFRTAVRVSRSINAALLGDFAAAVDGRTISIRVPEQYLGRVPELLALLDELEVEVSRPARVILNERTGTVVMGQDVTIDTVAIAHGGLTIQVDTSVGVSQPAPFGAGETRVVTEADVEAREEVRPMRVVGGVSIAEVVAALNALGVSPRDLIAILQAIQAAGALDAEVEVI